MANDLVVADLVKRYAGATGLNGVDFAVEAGEIFGLLGKNGAGKTTAIECIIGLRTPDWGTIQICGTDAIKHREHTQHRIGAQLQATALQDKITPREALGLFASFYQAPANVPSLIERFSLAEKADAPFDTLSGGQRQRLALALAFVNQPRILFLDEPTAGLDAQSKRQLHQMIGAMRDERRTVVLTTNDIDEAQEMCDRIGVIHHGKIIALGTPRELIAAGRGLSRIELRAAKQLDDRFFGFLSGVSGIENHGDVWRLKTEWPAKTISDLVRGLQAGDNELIDLHVHPPSLEDRFIELTDGRSVGESSA